MSVSQLAGRPDAASIGQSHTGGSPLARRWTAAAVTVALLTLVGLAVRLVVAHQSLFADELATYWIITTRGVGGVVSALYSTHDEITPPLSFVAFWLTTHISHTPELVRAPSLLAGTLTIPLVYLLGLRTVGRWSAVVATALTVLSPFMIYYSTEARGYGLMMSLSTLSTLAMLVAIDTRRARWWVLYAASSCAAMYTHYTSGFVLAAQLLWLLWAHPDARRPALLANLGALVAFLPWTGGFINDYNSPTAEILSALSPFSAHDVVVSLAVWAIGFPYHAQAGLSQVPGGPALVLLGAAVIIAVVGIVVTARRDRISPTLASLDRRLVLVFALALSVPLGEAIFSAFSTHIFSVRNLAASWPALALSFAVLLFAAGPRLRIAAAGLAILAFGLGAAKMVINRYQRPDYQSAAAFIEKNARSGDVVIDNAGVTPGPLTALDVSLRRPAGVRVFRAGVAAEHDHPFGFLDPPVPFSTAIHNAVAAAAGGRVFIVQYVRPARISGVPGRTKLITSPLPAPYTLVARRAYQGIVGVEVLVYGEPGSPRR